MEHTVTVYCDDLTGDRIADESGWEVGGISADSNPTKHFQSIITLIAYFLVGRDHDLARRPLVEGLSRYGVHVHFGEGEGR